MDSEQITIKIMANNPCVSVEVKESDGTVQKKHVSMQELVSRLSSMNKISTGLLPPNTRLYEGDSNNYNIVLEYPPKVRKFLLTVPAKRREAEAKNETYKPEELVMPYPFIVFAFSVKDYRISKTSVFANKKRIVDVNDFLHKFPFGNVYEDGHICWGENSLRDEIRSPNQLLGLAETFFGCAFNGDLTNSATVNEAIGCDRDFWSITKHLNGQQSFPMDALVEMGVSIGSVFKERY